MDEQNGFDRLPVHVLFNIFRYLSPLELIYLGYAFHRRSQIVRTYLTTIKYVNFDIIYPKDNALLFNGNAEDVDESNGDYDLQVAYLKTMKSCKKHVQIIESFGEGLDEGYEMLRKWWREKLEPHLSDGLPKLTKIEVSGLVNETFVNILVMCPNLNQLQWSDLKVESESFDQAFNKLHNLKVVEFFGWLKLRVGSCQLLIPNQLEQLSIEHFQYFVSPGPSPPVQPSVFPSSLESLPPHKLKKLFISGFMYFHGPPFDCSALITAFPNLQCLEIRAYCLRTLRIRNIEALLRFTDLETLSFTETDDHEHITVPLQLENCSFQNTLKVLNANVECFRSVANIPCFGKLVALRLWTDPRRTEADLVSDNHLVFDVIAHQPNLETLMLDSFKFSPIGLARLTDRNGILDRLLRLDISNADVSNWYMDYSFIYALTSGLRPRHSNPLKICCRSTEFGATNPGDVSNLQGYENTCVWLPNCVIVQCQCCKWPQVMDMT